MSANKKPANTGRTNRVAETMITVPEVLASGDNHDTGTGTTPVGSGADGCGSALPDNHRGIVMDLAARLAATSITIMRQTALEGRRRGIADPCYDHLFRDAVRRADQALAAMKLLDGAGASLIDAARAFRRTWDANRNSHPFGTAVTTNLASREDLRKSTRDSYSYTLESVAKPLAGRVLADLKTSDFEAILKDKGPTATRMHRANLRAFWRWASKAPREWCDVKILEALEVERISNDADIQILKPGDVEALLRAAEAEGPASAVAYSIAIFGGVRMAELEKLTWSDVHEDHIEISKSVAKRHSRRLIPICGSLRVWLATYRDGAEADDTIVPANWPEVSKCVRRRAGWEVTARRLKNPPKPTRGKWPSNACRHTCASVQVAIGTPLEDLTFKFGHSGGHDMLRKHYVSRLTKKDAMAILATRPK